MRRQRKDYDGAEQIYRRTILGFQEVGHRSGVAHQLECFGMLAAAQGRPGRAARLLGAAQALREGVQSHRLQIEQEEYEATLAQLAGALGEAERDRLVAEGRLMDEDQAIAFALG